MTSPTQSVWNVEFTGDYFALTSTVIADNEDEAVVNATQLLLQHYGMDIDAISNEINIWETAQ
jgi:hypothetical protein